MATRTYDCPICDEPCLPKKEEMFVSDTDFAHFETNFPETTPVVMFQCPLEHHFYVDRKAIEEVSQQEDEDYD